MDLYHIPGDTGKPMRRKVVLGLLAGDYIDGATDYCMLVPYADKELLSDEERVWLAYLYGLSYSCTTAIRMFEALPSTDRINMKLFKGFWRAEKDSLWFNPDKKYIKNNDQVIPAMKSIDVTVLTQYHSLKDWVEYNSRGGFNQLYKSILREWDFFGPMGAYLFFDALYGLCPELYINPDHLDWKNSGQTVVEGMAHMLYMDELIESREFPLDKFDRCVDKLQQHSGKPKVIIESTLCAFRKYFKGSRYLGYYADRMLEECRFVDSLKGVRYKPEVWKLREASVPANLRGEIGGWSGIRKERMKLWLERGLL